MSSCLFFKTSDGNPIAVGTPVIVIPNENTVRPFDALTDNKEDLVGVIYPKTRLTGREYVNGYDAFIKSDLYKLNQWLQYALDENNNFINNPEYDSSFDPYVDDSYALVLWYGIAAVQHGSAIRSSWIKLVTRPSDDSDLYLIRS